MQDIPYRFEVYRKIFHFLAIAIFPFFYFFLEKKYFMWAAIPITIIIVGVDFFRHKNELISKIFNRFFAKILRQHEIDGGLTGASFTAISAIITFGFFSKIVALIAFTILAISDSLASLVGKRIKSPPFFEKSIAGTSAFFISSMIILIVYGLYFKQEFAFYCFGTFAVFVTTMIEARPSLFRADDNLTIPLSFSIIMFLFAVIWELNF